MPQTRITTLTFAGGELDPRLVGRADLRAYANGLARARNVNIRPYGGLVRRPGLRYIDQLLAAAGDVRLISFEFNTEQTYLVVLTDQAITVYRDGVDQAISLADASQAATAIAGGTGSNIGNGTARGGLAAAFDGTTSALHTSCAADLGSGNLTVGKDYSGAPKRIRRVQTWPASDRGYIDNYPGDVTIELRAAAAPPANLATGGTLLGSLTVADVTVGPQVIESNDSTTAWACVWVVVKESPAGTGHEIALAEAVFWEPPAAATVPWSAADLAQVYWTQSADTLLVVHPDHPPQRITRSGHTEWTIADWEFVEDNDSGRKFSPHHKFADDKATLQASATTGTVTLTARAAKGGVALNLFQAAHVGVRFRLGDKEVEIAAVSSAPASTATATVIEDLADTDETTDFSEEAFSAVRGWPATVCFHQDRLVIGGARDLPNRMWMSKSADLFNFDLGAADDDSAIELPVLADQVNAVRAVVPGRHLQVYTSGAEWILEGDPITPANVQLRPQTSHGTRIDRTVPPAVVDGISVFMGRAVPRPLQFAWDELEQGYQAPELGYLSQHLFSAPVRAMAYDGDNRWLYIVNDDGTMAVLAIYRLEEVAGWSLHTTAGAFRAVAQVGDETYVAVERQGKLLLERYDESFQVDAGLTGTVAEPTVDWSGFDHLADGTTVRVQADGADGGAAQVAAGAIVLPASASAVQAGLAYSHEIEPLPPSLIQLPEGAVGTRVRLVAARFFVYGARSVTVTMGARTRTVPLRRFGRDRFGDAPPETTGEILVRALGWRRGTETGLWRIAQDTPLPFSLLKVEQELAVQT